MAKINPYLMVENGKEAIELYKELFGAKLVEHTPFEKEAGAHFGFPDDYDYENSTMHAILDINGAVIIPKIPYKSLGKIPIRLRSSSRTNDNRNTTQISMGKVSGTIRLFISFVLICFAN